VRAQADAAVVAAGGWRLLITGRGHSAVFDAVLCCLSLQIISSQTAYMSVGCIHNCNKTLQQVARCHVGDVAGMLQLHDWQMCVHPSCFVHTSS
jgi:hypothetical protein